MTSCPTCKRPYPEIFEMDAAAILALLREQDRERDVYKGNDGLWYVTYGGGRASAAAVNQLVTQGLIHSKYSDIPNEVYYLGRTINIEATVAARKKHGNRADLVYV